MALSKKELIDQIATISPSHIKKADIDFVLNAVAVKALTEIERGEDFTIPGIGKLSRGWRAERQGRNPQTGAALTIPARSTVKFSATKALKDAAASS